MRFWRTGSVLTFALSLVGGSIELSGQAGRMPPIEPKALSQAQKEAVARAFGGDSAPTAGPYAAWLRSPVVLSGRKIVGDYLLAYKGALPPKPPRSLS